MSRNVVLWSGGLDSTAILYIAGLFSSKENPVITLSLKEHHRFNADQLRLQSIARRNYLRFARRSGHFIQAQEISVSGNAEGDLSLRQGHLWPSLFAVYFKSDDTVSWGYKKGELRESQEKDMFRYLRAFDNFASDRESFINHILPLRDIGNGQFISMFREFGIPRDCVFSCNTLINKKPCGTCGKCETMNLIYGKPEGSQHNVRSIQGQSKHAESSRQQSSRNFQTNARSRILK